MSLTDAVTELVSEIARQNKCSSPRVFDERNASNAEKAAGFPDGTIVVIQGELYETDSSLTGTSSATSDLSQDGLRPYGNIRIEHFGGSAERMINWMYNNGAEGNRVFISGDHTFTAGIQLASGNDWVFNARFSFDGVASSSLIPMYGSNSTHVACLGSKSVLPPLLNDLPAGSKYVEFTSAHGLSEGDVFELVDRNDFSWGASRDYYRAGQICKVGSVISSTLVWIDQPICYDHAAVDMDCAKFNAWTGNISGKLQIVGNGSSTEVTYGLGVDFFSNISISGVEASKASYTAISIGRGIDFVMRNCSGLENGSNEFNGDYGIGFYSSWRGQIENCHGLSARHGITCGNVDGGTPFAFLEFENCTANSHGDPVGGSLGGDCHQIGHDISWLRCVFPTGFTDGAENIRFIDCEFHNFPGEDYCYYSGVGRTGGTVDFTRCKFVVNGASVTGTNGVIGMGISDSVFDDLKRDFTYRIRDIEVFGAPTGSTRLARISFGNPTFKVNVDIDGVVDHNDNSRSTLLEVMQATGTPITPDFIGVRGVRKAKDGINIAAYPSALPRPTAYDFGSFAGIIDDTTNTSSYTAASVVPLKWHFPFTPSVTTSINGPSTMNSGNEYLTASAYNVNTDQFTLVARLADYNTPFLEDVAFSASWVAECRSGCN